MDRFAFSAIAHRDHRLHSPLSEAKLERIVELLRLPPGAAVVDVGCGKAELLLRLHARYGARGTGLELSPFLVAAARDRVAAAEAAVEIREVDAAAWEPPAPAELAVCMGAAGAFGGTEGALDRLTGWVRPGGLILLDAGYWKQPPAPEYLELLGCEASLYGGHGDNVRLGLDRGLDLLYACVANPDEWDHYEGLYLQAVERYAREHPEDAQLPAMLERIRRWRDGYYAWGRETLGYGLYLFATPERAGD